MDNISALSSLFSTLKFNNSEAQGRITSAEKLSVTPESQLSSAVILSLNGKTTSYVEPDFASLVYNASTYLSGTYNQNFLSSNSEQEQIQRLIDTYSKDKT